MSCNRTPNSEGKGPGRSRARFQSSKNPKFFNSPSQSDGVGKEGTVPESLLKEARKTGSLNLSNRGISVIPPKLWRLNIDPPDGSTASFDVDERWWDQVELTRLDLSSNEIKEISEDIENFNSLSALEVRMKI
uniref:Leucine-rich repeat-containing protein 40 n=1 Tax=Amphimedon queenslandica TaxID=400682 RepID=A0A1X7SQ47_AMPQE